MGQPVKVYYIENEATKEIRKFSLENDVAGNFEYVAAKIRQTFPGLLRKDIEVFWKDEENEYVTISSDDELFQALENVHLSNGLLKLYVKVKKIQKNSDKDKDSNEEAREHTGITCDGCDSTVRGVRYKCTRCNDFDLCSSCESKNMHPSDHEMICIKLPRTYNHFARHPGYARGCRRGPRGRGGPFRRPGGFGWRFAAPPFGYPPHHTAPGAPPQNPTPEEESTTNEQGTPNEQQQQNWQNSMPECVRMVANTFGFDPDVATNYFEAYFGDFPQPQEQGGETSKEEDKKEQQENVKETENKEKDADNDVDFQKQSTEEKQEKKEDVPMVDLTQTSQAETEVLGSKENDSEAQNKMEKEVQSEVSPVADSSRREEFILVDEEKEGERALSEEEKFQRRLDKALKQMEAMGFDNEGGWLKQLLVSKDLSIGRVLDALNPSN